ncbi:MAG: Ig-like domain-containing protein, partial [Alphaproteobacteria bacterium]|nr:Ig-like domain-containing protein [Alphaproteobacteria bacterium]
EVTVDAVNDAPVAADDDANTDEDSAVDISVLANDGDADGDPLSVTGVTQGANGTVVNNGDGTLTYTPDADFNGTDSFTYTVSDGNGGSDSATVEVTVNAVNDDPENESPVAEDDTVLTPVDTAAVISVLTNDSDADLDPLSVVAAAQGSYGTVVNTGDGTVTYTPDAGFSGIDSFTYTVGDGNGGSDSAAVVVYVGTADAEGTSGDDVLVGGNSDDVIFGHGGNDDIHGGNGNGTDILFGGDGNDVIDGGNRDDQLFGGAGADTLIGGSGADTLDGGSGADVLNGGSGADMLNGGAGADMLNGGSGADTLNGGLGDDILVWDASDAAIDGGSGLDTLRVDGGNVDVTAFGGTIQGIDRIDLQTDAGANSVTLSAADVLSMSDGGSLTIDGDAGDSVDAGSGWTDGGIADGYHTYTQGAATLLVDTDVSVNPDILA